MASKRVAVDTDPRTSRKAGPASDLSVPKPKRKRPNQLQLILGACSCKGDCTSRLCGCTKKGQMCGYNCKCNNIYSSDRYGSRKSPTRCKNLFNTLVQYGIDTRAAAKDKCFMSHIFKIEDLRGHVEQTYKLNCCKSSVQLKDLIPGPAKCPVCQSEWSYSWCYNDVSETHRAPRHCAKCRQCKAYRNDHCAGCNKCYFKDWSERPCPTCQLNWSSDEPSESNDEVVIVKDNGRTRYIFPPSDVSVPQPKRKKPSCAQLQLGTCSCKGDCNSRRCGCSKKGLICGDHCKCTGCKNPFTTLVEYGIDCRAAAKDKCFMDHVFQIEDLRDHVEQTCELNCGDGSVQLKDLIGGPAKCPGCQSEWSYSWCYKDVWETHRAPVHCAKCRQCGDYGDSHCDECNKCYFKGWSGYSCPTCQPDKPPTNPDGFLFFTPDEFQDLREEAERYAEGYSDWSSDESSESEDEDLC